MEGLEVGYCQRGGVGTLFEMYYVLCHVVKPHKIMTANVAFGRRRKCALEGRLDSYVTVRFSRLEWSTYTFHLAKFIGNNLDDAQGLQP